MPTGVGVGEGATVGGGVGVGPIGNGPFGPGNALGALEHAALNSNATIRALRAQGFIGRNSACATLLQRVRRKCDAGHMPTGEITGAR